MSFQIRRISLTNFRKFRSPMVVEGLGPGLNIVIEPNEAGKSTLLEGLRAAFFVRHATRNQLASSFAPHGNAVAPQTEVEFDIGGAAWTITKRFLKSPSAELVGPTGRAQGEEAEVRLQQLLGFSRDNSHSGDPAARGALGLLWVAQADALSLTPPSASVRDTVRGVLETEVGAIMGGPAFEQVRQRIEAQSADYWTATGRPTGALVAATARRDAAEEEALGAETRQAGLETTYGDLETARSALAVVRREVADEADAEERSRLASTLELARGAAQILETRRAENEAANGRVRALEEADRRYSGAVLARTQAQTDLETSSADAASYDRDLATAEQALSAARATLAEDRRRSDAAKAAVTQARERLQRRRTAEAAQAGRRRLSDAEELQSKRPELLTRSETLIAAEHLARLETSEADVAAARARVEIGATTIELVGIVGGLTLNGEALGVGRRVLSGVTRIGLAGGAELIVSPPAASLSARAELEEAERRRDEIRATVGVADASAARARNERAREAAAEMNALDLRLSALTAADAQLGVGAGIDALRARLAAEAAASEDRAEDGGSAEELQPALDEAEAAVARAEGAVDAAVAGLRGVEQRAAPLAALRAAANEKLGTAEREVDDLASARDMAALPDDLRLAREGAVEAAAALADAQRNATVHDVEALARRIEGLDARTRTAQVRRGELERDVARLEATVETEGGKGLAERAAVLREESQAAAAACTRVEEDAATLRLLKEVLEKAKSEMSQTFVGPVARRAKQHIHRLLPGCDLTFSEDLGLEGVMRGGVSEGCNHLSKGTQEQLAVLTRLAFADLLLGEGRPVSLILDDPLAYSDDARLDLMSDILTDAGKRMQVILLTCRDRAFRHLGGTRIGVGTSAAAA